MKHRCTFAPENSVALPANGKFENSPGRHTQSRKARAV